jgi:8-hydroxy-5-deazaflavin:NADPH oxidoreductase
MVGGYGSLVALSSKKEEVAMTTAIIGTGNIGGTLARHLVRGGEPVVLAAKDEANAAALAQELGELARAASVEDAIAEADAVVFAVWLDTTKELIATDARLLENKVVIDPSNPLGFDESGQTIRTLPKDSRPARWSPLCSPRARTT